MQQPTEESGSQQALVKPNTLCYFMERFGQIKKQEKQMHNKSVFYSKMYYNTFPKVDLLTSQLIEKNGIKIRFAHLNSQLHFYYSFEQ